MANWGAHLPEFLQGVQRTRGQNTVEFETDYGPALVSKRGTAAESPVQAQIRCTPEQADDIDRFWEFTCACGATNFTKDGKTYRWADPPSRVDVLPHYVDMTISLMEQPS